MSLFMGNLSSHVRRDELERVFRRFGRCNIQLKDGYGFVVYDVPYNAERALRALRGKNICGDSISLTWSNKQPRYFQRPSRGGRFRELYRGRNTRIDIYGMKKIGSHDEPEYEMGTKHVESADGVPPMVDSLDREASYGREDIEDNEERWHNSKEGLMDEGGSIDPNPVENGRWGESASDPLNANEVENGPDFDRYEPYHGYNRRDDDGNHQMTSSYGSPNRGNSQEKHWRERGGETMLKNTDNLKPQQACYNCGLMGHLMRNCPQADASRREKLTRFDRRRDDGISFRGGGERDLKRLRSTSWGRPKSGKDTLLSRKHGNDRKAYGPGRSQKLIRKNEISTIAKEERHSQLRRNHRDKKREHEIPKKHHGKKARRSTLSPSHSKSTEHSSRSQSRSSKSASRTSSRSRSRSVSPRSRSMSSNSRPTSTSYSRSKSLRSRFRSRSHSPSLSLSVSLGRPLPSSLNKTQMKAAGPSPKGCLENAISTQPKKLLVEQKELIEGDASSDNSKLKSASMIVNNENKLLPINIEDEMKRDHFGGLDIDGNHSKLRNDHEVINPLEKSVLPIDNSPSENSLEKGEHQKSRPLVREHMEENIGRKNPEVPVNSLTKSSTRISSQEMFVVLKHYGLPLPGENENNLPIEDYFGSARLWPWDIVYYRRLKKGPISTENYARRIAQNKEFGIVDKYIRSSSGWGECSVDNS
ncbi:PREDICTED: serine/arginine-rich splicing factor 4-like [Nelumbo nucifera]|uniref:Serine/arginine-rich splicing factor 4-like n=2 Tax=Nelumbo nucifera TaxID=4432 RepID=A0A1U8Q1P2_NELNU|nr:PREDICTED: serine/arginine-rich splicing factor 4-like [Nelumbo nucifera]XP_019051906.1 PREDICTED: serine/arginine-rich splicing factor 4-like [Nelumbo nucifera]DAD48438.1 TPA_asm: hypothetical protein HUJ06_018375 [Nelumbo nucifera]